MESKKEVRKEKLSIYLARESVKLDSDLIKIESAKEPISLDLQGVESAMLYVKKQPPKNPPPWIRLFTESPAVDPSIFGVSSNVGSVFVVRIGVVAFVLSFGTGFHLIKTDAIERDFGLRVTLNSVDPDKLRGLDKASYDHNPLNSRTQSPRDVDIFNLRLDSEMEMLYAVTGVSQVEEFGGHVTGRDALTIVVEASLSDLPKILQTAYSQYKADLPVEFRWVENVNRVRDLDEIEILDLELNKLMASQAAESFWLGEPEIVDWESQVGYSFNMYPRTPRHVVLVFQDYLDFLEGQPPSVERMKSDVIHVNNADYQSVKSWSVYRCLYAELRFGGSHYIIRNGVWYKVSGDFVASVDESLQELKSYDFPFPLYTHDREEEYNEHICSSQSGFCLMDKKNIKIGGPYDKVEHCDLIRNGKDFVHVKVYKSSSTLSHLFSQGLVAAEAFIKDVWYRENLNPKLPDSIKLADPRVRPDPQNYSVVYAIATRKDIPKELPFFSKVSLRNALRTLRALNYSVALARIDLDDLVLKKKKFKPSKG